MAKKLLLIKDVEGLGRSGRVVQVKAGYARNFLLPQGSAVPATGAALRMQARLQEESKKRALEDKAEAEGIVQTLQSITLKTVVKVDQEGHMYGSVSAHDIVQLLQEQANVSIEKKMVIVKHPIKQTGEHKINVRLKEGVEGSLLLNIAAEEASNPVEKVSKA